VAGTGQNFTVTSTPQRFSFQIAVPSTGSNGIRLAIGSLSGFTSGVFSITGVQLELGTQVTSFDTRDYGRELIMCQRYFQKSYDIDTAVGTATRSGYINWNWGAMVAYGVVTLVLPVRMRIAPTVTNYNPDLVSTVGGKYWNGSSEVAFTGSLAGWAQWASNIQFNMDGTSRSNILFQWTASAEVI